MFLCGEVDYKKELFGLFGYAHRPTIRGCKAGWRGVLMAAAQVVARDYYLEGAPHVRDELADMIAIAETVYSCGVAAATRGHELPHGGCLAYPVLANDTKYYASRAAFDLMRLAEDTTGGIPSCGPSEKEPKNPGIATFPERFLEYVDDVPAENRLRAVRLIENISWGLGSKLRSATHGGGSGRACKKEPFESSRGPTRAGGHRKRLAPVWYQGLSGDVGAHGLATRRGVPGRVKFEKE
ncbi:MAG: 4-hydroxyphenylacetate 3-hydroxylase C-terminal domain-containing protein [Actinomycetota bacterium]